MALEKNHLLNGNVYIDDPFWNPRLKTLFDVTLVTSKDLTPNNREDNYTDDGTTPECLELKRYYPTAVCTTRDTTSLYTYYRFVFDNVTVDELTVGVFADVYYNADIDYNARAYGTLCLYWNEDVWIAYPLSANDKAALAGKQ